MKRILFLAILLAFSASNLEAQKLKKFLKDKKKVIQRELDRKADQKIKEGVSQGIDGLFKKKPQSGENESAKNKRSKNKSKTKSTETLTTVYKFNASINFDLVVLDGTEKYKVNFVRLLANSNDYVGVELKQEGDKVISIFDFEKKQSLAIIPKNKTAVLTSLKENSNNTTTSVKKKKESTRSGGTGGTGGGTEGDLGVPKLIKTGLFEKIAGYKADQYIWKDEEGKIRSLYITTELNYDLEKSLGNSGASSDINLPKGAPKNGVVLKYSGQSKDGTNIEMTAKKVRKHSTSFKMANYKVTKH